jgi:hypothetical protein
MNTIRRHDCKRRGTTLVLFTVAIPAAIALFLLVQTRVMIAFAEAQRQQQRVQARLLAESALAVFQTRPAGVGANGDTALPATGAIEGEGVWRLEMDKDGMTLVARGEVDGGFPGYSRVRAACTIRARITLTKEGVVGEELQFIDTSYERMPVGQSKWFPHRAGQTGAARIRLEQPSRNQGTTNHTNLTNNPILLLFFIRMIRAIRGCLVAATLLQVLGG